MTQKPPAARAKSAKPRPATTTPEELTTVVPNMGYDNHSFILQAIMANQTALGRIEASLTEVKADIAGIESTVHNHTITLALCTGAMIIIIAIGGFTVNAAWPKVVQLMSLNIPGIENAIEQTRVPAQKPVTP